VRAGLALDGLNFTDGATAQVAGALASTPSTSQALAASLSSTNGASGFLTYAGAVNPSAQFGDAAASHPSGAAVLAAEPGFAANGSYGFSNTPPQLWFGSYAGITPFAPELVVGNFPNTGSNVSFGSNGTVSFFNPFPSGWTLFLVVEVPFTVQLNVSGMGAVPVAGRLHSQGGLSSYIGAIGARLSPVTSPKINGAAANHAGNTQLSNFNASQPLLFSWSAPALGSPTRYTVTVWALDANGVSGTPAAVLQTKSLQAQLPAGWLQSGTPYVAYITAVSSDADRLGLGVLAYDGNADFADCISSAFQVQ